MTGTTDFASTEGFGKTTTRTWFTTAPFGSTAVMAQPSTWVKIKLRLETAGPVAVGTNTKNIVPVLSGAGGLLGADEVSLVLKKGDILYIAANATNRVRMVTEPIPWQQQILLRLGDIVGSILGPKAPPPAPPKKGPLYGTADGKKRW